MVTDLTATAQVYFGKDALHLHCTTVLSSGPKLLILTSDFEKLNELKLATGE